MVIQYKNTYSKLVTLLFVRKYTKNLEELLQGSSSKHGSRVTVAFGSFIGAGGIFIHTGNDLNGLSLNCENGKG